MKTATIIIGSIALVLVLPLLVFGWSATIQWFTAPFRGALDQREQIQASGDFRIYSYNHFYNLCRNVQEAQATHDNQADVLESMAASEDGYARQRRTVAILKSEIEQRKQRYNADAAKEETTAAFRANNLPSRLPITSHTYGERANCQF